jgi:phenylacetate-coenzyme A ligase PaaK-like adenylate-forming protein
MKPESSFLAYEIIQFIERFSNRTSIDTWDLELENAYNETALRLFSYQFKLNAPYRKYCQARRKSPLTVSNWRDIPPIPIQAFKELTLSCEPENEAEAVFMTSGTTNADKKGRNYHPTLQVWDASMAASFKHFVMPDCERITMFVLTPGKELNPNSSLSRYVSMAVEHYGSSNSRFFFKPDVGLDMEEVAQALKASELRGEPVLLIGATFSYVHLLDYCHERGLRFSLPDNSRIFDTGGLKGQAREVTAEELHQAFASTFHIERDLCLNMYGMTELSSQIYDQSLRSRTMDGPTLYEKTGPAWIRTLVLNPDTLEPVKQGETGVLAHYDLPNWNSCLAILTEDMGYFTEKGFVLLGRAQGSEARGCSIAIDQLMQANKN